MLRKEDLLEALGSLKGRAYYGQTYRVFKPKYLLAPLSTEGAFHYGGRYNPPKQLQLLYLAEDPITALSEARMLVDPLGSMLHRSDSRIILATLYRLERVLDLSDLVVLDTLDTSFQELTGDWTLDALHGRLPPTQRLGQACFEQGSFEAIRYPSAQNRSFYNFAIYRDRLQEPSFVRIKDSSGVFSGALPEAGQINLEALQSPIAQDLLDRLKGSE
jgi:RES domain-containing protein